MIDKKVRNVLLTFFFYKMTKILNFLTNIIVKKKKMCYNEIKLRNKELGGGHMWVWILFPFLVLIYTSQSKKIKRLEKRLKVIERKEKGNIDMSRLLQELIGKKPTIVGQVFGTNLWEVVDVDEEWVKLRHIDKNGKEKFKLQRIEDIQTVEFDGE